MHKKLQAICQQCDGEGQYEQALVASPYDIDPPSKTVRCEDCDGTGWVDADGFTISSRMYDDGKREIHVIPGKSLAKEADLSRRRATWTGSRPKLEDWLVAEADTLEDARSILMTEFGIGWFNRARKQLNKFASA